METFAQYILNEKALGSKMEIVYYLAKKEKIFFDKSVIFKTELLRMFLNNLELGLDKNILLTANLLASCKKIEVSDDLEKIKAFSKVGAEYLYSIGFDEKFCKICEGINRYTKQEKREKESDVLELIDQFGGMILDRPERIGMKPDEALVILEHRNLKGQFNRYLQSFIDFINEIEQITIKQDRERTPIELLLKLYKETANEKRYITAVIYEYEQLVDEAFCKAREGKNCEIRKNMLELEKGNPNRSLFSEETTQKIIGKLIEK